MDKNKDEKTKSSRNRKKQHCRRQKQDLRESRIIALYASQGGGKVEIWLIKFIVMCMLGMCCMAAGFSWFFDKENK